MRAGGRWFDPPARPIFSPRINDSHCNTIQSSLTTVQCFDDGYEEKQPMAWKEYDAEYWLKELQKSIDECTGRRDIIEITLKRILSPRITAVLNVK